VSYTLPVVMRRLGTAARVLAAAAALALPAAAPAAARVAPTAGTAPAHLVILMEENKGYWGTVGNSSMPYWNSLWSEGKAHSANVLDMPFDYAVSHPSLPNYLALTSGGVQGTAGSDTVTAGSIHAESLWDELSAAGISYALYQEGMPSPCYPKYSYNDTTTDGQYVLRHNPGPVYAPVYTSSECLADQPLSALNPSSLPTVSFITPNVCDDFHGIPSTSPDPFQNCVKGSTALTVRSDQWLSTMVPKLTAAGADVLITWDEGSGTAGPGGTTGGGRLASMWVGPDVTAGVNDTQFNDYGILATVQRLYGVGCLLDSCTATPAPAP
jgi:hypothetical protein